MPDFFWCPDPNCKSGQIHDAAITSPIVSCIGCRQRFCFHHRVPWERHETLSCDEYDAYLADPVHFRSRYELAVEEALNEFATIQLVRRAQEEEDLAFAQTLVAAEEREEAERQAEIQRQARMEEERQERARREEESRRAEAERSRRAKEILRHRREEQANMQTIKKTTKDCPQCKWPIEKISGW